jgi:hypothetical protein
MRPYREHRAMAPRATVMAPDEFDASGAGRTKKSVVRADARIMVSQNSTHARVEGSPAGSATSLCTRCFAGMPDGTRIPSSLNNAVLAASDTDQAPCCCDMQSGPRCAPNLTQAHSSQAGRVGLAEASCVTPCTGEIRAGPRYPPSSAQVSRVKLSDPDSAHELRRLPHKCTPRIRPQRCL